MNYASVGMAVGVTRQAVQRWITCKTNPSWKRQEKLGRFFGLKPDKLLKISIIQEEKGNAKYN
jgi:hypothetical protein